MDPMLTLATAVARARASETVKKQQSELQEQAQPAAVGEVKSKRKPKQAEPNPRRKPVTRRKACGYCGPTFIWNAQPKIQLAGFVIARDTSTVHAR